MKPTFLLLIPLFIFSCAKKTEQVSNKEEKPAAELIVQRQAAEYEPQSAVWLIWSPADHLADFSNEEVDLSIIEALVPYVKVHVTTADSSLFIKAKSQIPATYLESGEVEVHQIPSVEIWARDMGPNFVETNQGLAIADFNFNAWGYSDTLDASTQIEEKYDENIAKLLGLPVISTSLISEGGDREVNGEGTLIVVEAVEAGRNPNMTKEEMNAEFQRVLGVTNVIWLKEGLHEDDHTFRGTLELEAGEKAYTVITTNGHIDEFARFVNDSTILLGQVDESDMDDPIALENHRRMEENYTILKHASDQDGKPFNIVRMPLPKTILGKMKPGDSVYDYISTLTYQDGSTFPKGEEITVVAAASYLNFLISNEVVIGQKYWREGWDDDIRERDEQAKAVLQSVFPNRKIVMIDALAVNFGGGGVHCITMHQPAF